jgi:transcriptional regulator with XRE-family HTH domain
MLKAIFWDNDGVLVDTEGLYFEATRATLARAGFALTSAHYADLSLRQGRSVFELVRDAFDAPAIEILRAARNARYAELLAAGVPALDGVEAVLGALHGRLSMGVVTSSNPEHFEIIHRTTGLLGYFDFVLPRHGAHEAGSGAVPRRAGALRAPARRLHRDRGLGARPRCGARSGPALPGRAARPDEGRGFLRCLPRRRRRARGRGRARTADRLSWRAAARSVYRAAASDRIDPGLRPEPRRVFQRVRGLVGAAPPVAGDACVPAGPRHLARLRPMPGRLAERCVEKPAVRDSDPRADVDWLRLLPGRRVFVGGARRRLSGVNPLPPRAVPRALRPRIGRAPRRSGARRHPVATVATGAGARRAGVSTRQILITDGPREGLMTRPRARRFDLPYAEYMQLTKYVKQIRRSLDTSSKLADTSGVRDGGTLTRPRRAGFVARASELGAVLADLRGAKGLSLREVEEATGRAVSNAYLSQLENGKIQKPSPKVLQSLSAVYAVPYEALLEKAGYLLPSEDEGAGLRRRLAAFAIDDLTAEEEEELLKYLAFLRSRGPS